MATCFSRNPVRDFVGFPRNTRLVHWRNIQARQKQRFLCRTWVRPALPARSWLVLKWCTWHLPVGVAFGNHPCHFWASFLSLFHDIISCIKGSFSSNFIIFRVPSIATAILRNVRTSSGESKRFFLPRSHF